MAPTFNVPADALARLRMLAEQKDRPRKTQTSGNSTEKSDSVRKEKKP